MLSNNETVFLQYVIIQFKKNPILTQILNGIQQINFATAVNNHYC